LRGTSSQTAGGETSAQAQDCERRHKNKGQWRLVSSPAGRTSVIQPSAFLNESWKLNASYLRTTQMGRVRSFPDEWPDAGKWQGYKSGSATINDRALTRSPTPLERHVSNCHTTSGLLSSGSGVELPLPGMLALGDGVILARGDYPSFILSADGACGPQPSLLRCVYLGEWRVALQRRPSA